MTNYETPVEEIIPVIAPEFGCRDTSLVIEIAEMQVGENLCGKKRPMLVAYLAAHILALGERTGGAGGSVASLSEGALSVSFGTTGVMGSLGQTSYGIEYDRLSRGCIFAARTRVSL
jgi:hypothetical protein